MMGQSAGASSIMHHITAWGGGDGYHSRPSMQGAIIQSPGFFPQPNDTRNDEMYTTFLELTNATNLEALFTLDTKVLQDANAKMVHESMYGYFNFGPTIDGNYVPDLPGKILAQGNLPTIPAMLLGHMKLDGLLFTPPWIRTTPALLDYVRELFSSVPQSVLDAIASGYPVPTKLGPQLALLKVADFLDVGYFSPLWQTALTQFHLGHRNPMQLILPHGSFAQVTVEELSPGVQIRFQFSACGPWL